MSALRKEPERCKVDEAMLVTGLERRTLQNLSARGHIWGAAKLGGQWTYDRQALRAWVKAQENAVKARQISSSATASGMAVFRSQASPASSRLKLVRETKLRGD